MGKNSIPDCPVVTDLIPGDAGVLETLADTLALYSTASADAAGRMRPMAKVEEWGGEAAEGFVGQMEDLPKTLDRAVRHFTDAANALRGYAGALRQAQADVAARVIPEANAARAWSAQWQLDREAARNSEVTPSLPDKDFGKERLEDAEEELSRIRGRLKDAQEDFTKSIDKGIQAAPSGGDPITTALTSFGGGAKDSVVGLVETAAMLNPGRLYAEPGAYLTDLQQLASGYQKAFTDPVGFAKDAVNWEEWSKNPARALGLTAPDLLLSVLTGGGSKAVTIAKPDAPDPIDLSKKDRPKDTCESCGDPVDPVTGEVSLAQIDLQLAGALPLVLGRDHRSSYRHGRHFGASWASVLDQHVEFDEGGVVFRSADGVTLRYPMPEPDRFVLPYGGSRWPLAWDGRPDGPVVIGKPKLGVGLTFRPIAGSKLFVLESVIDRNGNAIAVEYDDQGTPISVRHSGGYHIAVDTAMGRIIALRLLDTHPESHLPSPGAELTLVRYGYSEQGDLAEVFDSSGTAQRFTYDDRHRMISWRDRNGTEYHYEYDSAGRCVRTCGSGGCLNGSFHYDDSRRLTRYTNSLGDVSEYAYNEWSQVERITDPLGHTVVKEWDQWHQLRAVTDQCGHTTRYAYDHLGNVLAVERPDGTRLSAEYDDALCLPVRLVDPDGSVRSRTYSARGTLVTATDAAGSTTVFAGDECGNVALVTDPLSATTRLTHNEAGLPKSVVDPLGAVTSYERDAWGRVVAVTAPDGTVTRRAWTIEGRPLWYEQPDGTRQTWTWDGEGNLTEQCDAAGGITFFETTGFDLTSARIGPDGVRYEFAYDTELRLTEVTDPRGLTWTYEYDPAGRLISETDFDGRELTYRHDPSGRLTLRSNGAAEIVSYTRDPMGRLLSQQHEATGRATTFTYDTCGRLTRATNPDVDLVIDHDVLGRVVAESSNDRVLVNTFDVAGRRVSRETPAGILSEWHWDSASRPTSMITAGETMVFSYDQAGREIGRGFGPNLNLATTWDVNGRLSTQSLVAGETQQRVIAALEPERASRRLTHREYAYRADGYVASMDDQATGLRTYDLDPVGRVTAVHGNNWSERYTYDAAGNTTDATWPGADTDAQGSRDVRGTLVHRAGRTQQTYDEQGRVVRRTRKTLSGMTKTWTYSWDADDRLSQVTTPAGEHWEYMYDPLGRRTEKRRLVDPGGEVAEWITFTWDGSRIVERSTDTGETTAWDYEPGTYRPLTQTNLKTVSQDEIDRRFFAVVTDLVGTPTELVSTDSEIAWQLRSTLWGVSAAHAREIDCPFRFPGQYHDSETDSNYNLFRYYISDSISYGTADPLGLVAAPNNHGYVANPLSGYDPLGLAPCELGEHSDAAEQGAAHLQDEVARGNDNHRLPGVDMNNRDAVAKYLQDVMDGSPGYSVQGGKKAWYDPESGLFILRKNDYSMTARAMTPAQWETWLGTNKD